MSRNAKIMSIASEEALNSRQTFRHGAVITGPGSKIISVGHNKGNRTKILKKVFTCTHAEMDALNKFVSIQKQKYGKKYWQHPGKYSMWVTRLENSKSGEIKNTFSKPCYFCSKLMEEYGIKRVYYTLADSSIVCTKINDLNSTHKSGCQLNSENVDTNIKLRLF